MRLIRPAVANIDQALVVFAITKPNPHFNSAGPLSCYDGKQRDSGCVML